MSEIALNPLQTSFRDVMGGVATPVTVVTTSVDQVPHGTTVSAFASLSMAPPMVMVALDRSSALLAVVRTAGRFGVNVLGRRQATAALAFARKGGAEKFHGVPWTPEDGLPRLDGATGWLACEVAEIVEGGDHLVLLGRVVQAATLPGSPLTYHARTFGTHAPVPTVVAAAGDWDDETPMQYAYCVG